MIDMSFTDGELELRGIFRAGDVVEILGQGGRKGVVSKDSTAEDLVAVNIGGRVQYVSKSALRKVPQASTTGGDEGERLFKSLHGMVQNSKPIAIPNKYVRKVYNLDKSASVETDVYAVIDAYAITNAAAQHAAKKVLCAGLRGVKNRVQDYQEAIEALQRAIQMEAGNA